jgi:hypothetical protein
VGRARCCSFLLCMMVVRHDKRRCFRIVAQFIVAIAENRVPLRHTPRSGSSSLRLDHPHGQIGAVGTNDTIGRRFQYVCIV